MKQQFNIDEALELIKQGARTDSKDGVLDPLIKQLTEAVLEAEIESHSSTYFEYPKCKLKLLNAYLELEFSTFLIGYI